MRRAVGTAVAVAVLTLPAALGAQSAGGDVAPAGADARPRRAALEVWGGLGTHSPQWGILGETPDMNLGLVVVRWTRPLGAPAAPDELPAFEWTFDLVPLAVLSPPLVSLRGSGVPCPDAALCVVAPRPGERDALFPPGAPFGVGFTPLGLTRRFNRTGRVSPFVGVNGGALYFSERVPTTKASRFNFTASAELGLRMGPPDQPGITVAYRFHHISNAGTVGENPGVASHLITLGVHRPRR